MASDNLGRRMPLCANCGHGWPLHVIPGGVENLDIYPYERHCVDCNCRNYVEKGTETVTLPTCSLCGEPMPQGEEMFNYHGFSGPCPKPPIQKPSRKERIEAALARMKTEAFAECSLAEEVEGILREVLAEGR
jgi:hypothetical protein